MSHPERYFIDLDVNSDQVIFDFDVNVEDLSICDLDLTTNIIINEGGEYYTGEYEVDPTFEEQILQTQDKMMLEDVTVHAIEVSRVSNPSGGKTVYIGGSING